MNNQSIEKHLDEYVKRIEKTHDDKLIHISEFGKSTKLKYEASFFDFKYQTKYGDFVEERSYIINTDNAKFYILELSVNNNLNKEKNRKELEELAKTFSLL